MDSIDMSVQLTDPPRSGVVKWHDHQLRAVTHLAPLERGRFDRSAVLAQKLAVVAQGALRLAGKVPEAEQVMAFDLEIAPLDDKQVAKGLGHQAAQLRHALAVEA